VSMVDWASGQVYAGRKLAVMPRRRREKKSENARRQARPERGLARGRHGRGIRSSVAGPYLPMLTGRVVRFENHVADAMNYLRAANPERLANVQVDIANVPKTLQHSDGMDRWHVEAPNRIILYRVAIDRLARLHCEDPVHYRMLVERCVLQAVAELLGSDPWDIAPERFGDE
jgi:hypothetical protein